MATTRRAAFTALAAVLIVVLAGCVPTTPMPTPTGSPSSSPTPTAAPPPTLDPEGSAEDNLDYFDAIVGQMASAMGMQDGSGMIATLVAAGFNKADMELTPNETAIGERADSVIFSVRFNGECLIGQIFPSAAYTVTRAPLLGTGTCLVGATRPIDF